MAQILEITKEETIKTQIMYKANLSFSQLNEYLQFMAINNLITHKTREGRGVYATTLKGFNFIQMYSELRQLVKRKTAAHKSKFHQNLRKNLKLILEVFQHHRQFA